MFANQYNLDNLCVIIDSNGLQIDGACEDVMSAEPIDAKLKAFGFDVVIVDGHDFDQLETAFDAFHNSSKPFAIIMKTVKGKGVSYMENQVGWHGKAPNEEEYNIAMAELRAHLAEVEEA
jgi:transketolase